MGNLPPAVNAPPTRGVILDANKEFSPPWRQWFTLMHDRVGGAIGSSIIGDVAVFETAVNQSGLASAAAVILLTAKKGERWKVRDLRLSGAGTDFSGGNRLLDITDGTATWTVIPAATLQSLSAAAWGDSGLPYPATAADLTVASTASTNIVATYSGGSSDYAAGVLTVIITAERIA